MRIGFDAKRVFHNFRGLGSYGRTLLAGLQQFYPEYYYFLYTPPFYNPRSLAWAKEFSALQVRTPASALERSFPNLWRGFSLSKSLEKDRLDIYHGLSHELPAGIKGRGIKTVVTIHDLIFLRFPQFFYWADRYIYLKKLRYACDRADIIVAICEQTKNDLIEFLHLSSDRIRVVYQGIHPRFYKTLDKGEVQRELKSHGIEGPYILFVGAFEERKNVLGLISAFCKIKDKVNHQLVLIGWGSSYEKKMLEIIKKENIEHKVKVLGNISCDKLPAFYRGCDLFCYPSHFEGFGLPIVEALFCQKPVVTSKGSCFPEAAGPGAVYVDSRSVNDLASALLGVLGDAQGGQEMVKKGWQYVQKFHWKRTSENLVNLYKELR